MCRYAIDRKLKGPPSVEAVSVAFKARYAMYIKGDTEIGRARCVAPRACRRRERCLFEARFGRWPLAWRKIWAVTMFDLAV